MITYELLTGALPFNDETPEKVFQNILNRQIKYPPIGTEDGQITKEAHDFMERLMCSDPENRLGSGGIHEIKEHPFLKGTDWKGLFSNMSIYFIPIGKDADANHFKNA